MSTALAFTPREQAYYHHLFDLAKDGAADRLEAAQARPFLEKSGLSVDVLRQIWEIADHSSVGSLDPLGFCAAMRLIGHAQGGQAVTREGIYCEPNEPCKFEGIPFPWTAGDWPETPDAIEKGRALHAAVKRNDLDGVRQMLDDGGNVESIEIAYCLKGQMECRCRPLHRAVQPPGLPEMVELLVGRRADVDAKEYDGGHTPLYQVAAYGSLPIMQTLLAARADVNAAGRDHPAQNTPEIEDGHTPIFMAGAGDHIEAVGLLVDAKADVNFQNPIGVTPLAYTAWYGKLCATQALLAAKADPLIKANEGLTAFDIAKANEIDDAILQLLGDAEGPSQS